MTRKTSILLGLAGAGALLPLAALAQSTGNEFVPLTAIPVFSSLTNTSNIAGFLNALYRICIGVAASLAVIQIFRAGMEFMLNTGSFTHNEKAKNLISGAVFGLLLVLSPAIVFSIIDPRILDLKLDTSSLQLAPATPGAVLQTCQSLGSHDGDQVQPDFKQCCAAHGFTAVAQPHSSAFVCRANVPEETSGAGKDAAGNYYFNVQTTSGEFGTLRYNSADGQSCVQVAYSSYAEKDACTAATNADVAARGGAWITVGSVCTQEDGSFRKLSGANVAFCSAVEPLKN